MLGTYLIMSMMHFFFRNGQKNDFASIKFGAGFLGFQNYNFFLHGFLTLTATYTSHLIPLTLLPLYLTTDLT
jgi:hypothetical protein